MSRQFVGALSGFGVKDLTEAIRACGKKFFAIRRVVEAPNTFFVSRNHVQSFRGLIGVPKLDRLVVRSSRKERFRGGIDSECVHGVIVP